MSGVGTGHFPPVGVVASEVVLLADESVSSSVRDGEPISLNGLSLLSVVTEGLFCDISR